MILLAGSDVWFELDALAQWGHEAQEIAIVFAHDDELPGRPADRLRGFIRSVDQAVEITMLGPVDDQDPASTANVVLDHLRCSRHRWRGVASGGTRMMMAGLLHAQRHVAMTILHPRSPGDWNQICPNGELKPIEGTSARAMDRFRVAELLAATWGDEERLVRVVTPRENDTIAVAARRCIGGDSWRRSLDKIRSQDLTQAGFAFEAMVARILRELGIDADDVVVGPRLMDGTRAIQEVDVVANSHGRLHVIDCKLRSAEDRSQPPLGTQIREAETTLRHLGDGAGQYILLRPNRVLDEEMRSLCSAYDIRVVDRVVLERENLAEVLARLVRTPVTRARSEGRDRGRPRRHPPS